MTLPGYHDTMDISSQTSRFIAAHRNQDVRDLALSAKRVDGLDLPFALDQIAGWQTACRKLPQWAETDGIVYRRTSPWNSALPSSPRSTRPASQGA